MQSTESMQTLMPSPMTVHGAHVNIFLRTLLCTLLCSNTRGLHRLSQAKRRYLYKVWASRQSLVHANEVQTPILFLLLTKVFVGHLDNVVAANHGKHQIMVARDDSERENVTPPAVSCTLQVDFITLHYSPIRHRASILAMYYYALTRRDLRHIFPRRPIFVEKCQ